MAKNPLQAAADRLGFMAYRFVMGGGRPVEYRFVDNAGGVRGAGPQTAPAAERRNPFDGTAPLEPEREDEKVASY